MDHQATIKPSSPLLQLWTHYHWKPCFVSNLDLFVHSCLIKCSVRNRQLQLSIWQLMSIDSPLSRCCLSATRYCLQFATQLWVAGYERLAGMWRSWNPFNMRLVQQWALGFVGFALFVSFFKPALFALTDPVGYMLQISIGAAAMIALFVVFVCTFPDFNLLQGDGIFHISFIIEYIHRSNDWYLDVDISQNKIQSIPCNCFLLCKGHKNDKNQNLLSNFFLSLRKTQWGLEQIA